MIEKYTRAEMGAIWSIENKYRCWLTVEVAVAEAWSEIGRVPAAALTAIRAATFDLNRIAEIEDETQHDVIAFLRNLSETVGPDSRWIHLGLTSSDVIDTALALQLVQSTDLLLRGVKSLRDVVGTIAVKHRTTVMMGRTHNVHAEPITFGHKMAVWYAELRRHEERLLAVRKDIAVAKIGGAVGTHANVTPEIEQLVASRLGLVPEEAATQVVQRDRHAAYVLEIALLGSSLDKISTELRNLQHTEIREIEEPFRVGQQGSSAMPHKRNPILNERISGLARVLRGYAVPALENVVLWHERDISNSSVERVILPDASTLIDYMLHTLMSIVRDSQVNTDRMTVNVEASHGLFFSEKVLTALIEAGMSREDAYALVQRGAMSAYKTGRALRTVLESDPEITSLLSPEDLDAAFRIDAFLRYIDTAFTRLGLGDDT
ncbi:MAG: adenylosuccinate lyase [Chloroflexota bacterium]